MWPSFSRSEMARLLRLRFTSTPHRSRRRHRYGTARGVGRESASGVGAHSSCRGKTHVRRHHLHGKRQDVYKRRSRSEEHTSELQSRLHLVCRLLLEKKKKKLYQSQSLYI